MSITTTPVREKALLKNDSIFSGNKIVMMSDQTGPTITGNITIHAFVCIATKDDVKDDFHYIVCQNVGDNKNPEIFLRLRGDGTNANFECGVWDGATNFLVKTPYDSSFNGKVLDIVGMCDGTTWKIYINGILRASEVKSKSALAVQNAYWAIGSHNYRPYPRYFKGRIFYAAVYNSALANFAELDTDSDNNGYIGQITINPENARYEDGLKLTNPKPITYIDSTKAAGASIPDDYIRVPLRVMYLTDDRNAEFCFASSNGVKVIKSDGTDAETAWTDISSLNISTVSMAAGKEGTFVDNYYAVATSKTNPETTLDVSLQIKRNGTTISDTVKFLWQEAPTVASPQGQKYEWIVPSGWKISGNTFTTPITPYEAPIPPATVRYTKAVGPKTEGSGVITNSGDIISVVSYDNGFVMELDFAFIRNTSMRNISDAFIEGYIQPTFNVNGMENERVDIQKRHQMDFVGNSGIKFFNNEVQIFDIIALQNSINLTSEDDVDPQTYKINPKTVDGINYGVEDGAATDRRTKVGNTITGNAYDNTEVNFRTYADFMVAYNRQIPGVDVNIHLFIDITKIGNSLTILTKVKNRQGVLENVYNGPNVKELTGGSTYVRIQSHWGSGVRISNISISAK